jgi:hypothetical protein
MVHPHLRVAVSTPYLPPLDQLLALGEPEFGHLKPWPDYLSMGFTAEHVPELIRMAGDDALDPDAGGLLGTDVEPEWFAYIHAWRILGLLRAEAAIPPLMEALSSQDDDWAGEELPSVLGMIGPAAFEPLRIALASWSLAPEPWAAAAAANGLVELAQRFPETRDAAVAALTRQLRWWGRHDPILNTMLVSDLVALNAVEAAPVIEEAFAAGAVETENDDDWEDVQVALGLLRERITPKPAHPPRIWLDPTPPAVVFGRGFSPEPRKDAAKAGRRRKRKRR